MSDSSNPLVSIVVPTYTERRDTIERALASIGQQSYSRVEVIVVDSGEQTWLEERCEEQEEFEYVAQPPNGVSVARNAGLDRITGDIVAFLDADDRFTEGKLTKQVDAIESGADVVYSDVYVVKANGNDRRYRESFEPSGNHPFHVDFFRFDGKHGNIPTSTLTIKTSLLNGRQFDESLVGGEDYHLWVRLFADADRIDHLNTPLTIVRERPNSLSADYDMMYENRLRAIERLCDEHPELRPFRRERKLLERYDYARHLLFDERTSKARSIFWELFTQRRHLRSGLLLAISYAPVNRKRLIGLLDTLRARIAGR